MRSSAGKGVWRHQPCRVTLWRPWQDEASFRRIALGSRSNFHGWDFSGGQVCARSGLTACQAYGRGLLYPIYKDAPNAKLTARKGLWQRQPCRVTL
jgi:hypothetical protein